MIPKFRMWNKITSKMHSVDGLYFDSEEVQYKDEVDVLRFIKFGNTILMHSTGLCDKEGTEVFEGDILHHQIQTEYTFIVKYDKDNGRWYGDGLSRTYRIDIAKRFLPYYYKVIGNIYENPELLNPEHFEVE